MKLIFITPSIPPTGKGGQDKTVLKQLEHFSKLYKCCLITEKGIDFKYKFPIYYYQSKFSLKNNFLFFLLLKNVMTPDSLIHYHYPNHFFPNILGIPIFLLIQYIKKSHYFVQIHLIPSLTSKYWSIFKPFYHWILTILFNKAEKVFVPTQYSQKRIMNRYHVEKQKIVSLPYGVSDLFFKISKEPKNFNQEEKFRIIYFGRLHSAKRVSMLIDAFKSIEIDNVSLDIYGDGPEKERIIEGIINHPNIKYHGYISTEIEIYNALKQANLMVLPSIVEEMPLSIMEALAMKVPVLCTKLKTIYSIYSNNVNYFDGSQEDLRNQMKDILIHKDFKKTEKGYNFAQNFRWERHFEILNKSYKIGFASLNCK